MLIRERPKPVSGLLCRLGDQRPRIFIDPGVLSDLIFETPACRDAITVGTKVCTDRGAHTL